MTRYVTTDDIMRLNAAEVGLDQLRDFGALESAVLRPQATVYGKDAYPTLHAKAAVLLHSLVRNHAFVDGNKRTGVLAVILFYGLNDHLFYADQGELVALAIDVAMGQITVERVESCLEKWATIIDFGGREDFGE